MQKKYQVFISSTFRDLVEERQDTLKSVLDMGHIPSGMEIFPAADVEQFDYIKKIIDECDYYVLIVAARYGSVDEAGVSFTEKEYRYAVREKKTVLAFIHNDVGNITSNKTDGDQALGEKLALFRKEIARGRLVQFWSSRDDLKAKVIISPHKAMSEYPAIGWMRADTAASEDLLAQINNMRLENEELRSRAVPAFEGAETLAEVQSTFLFHYRFQQWDNSRRVFRTVQSSFNIDWKTLFVLVAPQFAGPRSVLNTSDLIGLLQEKQFIARDRKSVELYQSDVNTMEAQFHGYGLLTSEVATSVGGGVKRFTELTPMGRRRHLEWATVKASESEPTPQSEEDLPF